MQCVQFYDHCSVNKNYQKYQLNPIEFTLTIFLNDFLTLSSLGLPEEKKMWLERWFNFNSNFILFFLNTVTKISISSAPQLRRSPSINSSTKKRSKRFLGQTIPTKPRKVQVKGYPNHSACSRQINCHSLNDSTWKSRTPDTDHWQTFICKVVSTCA